MPLLRSPSDAVGGQQISLRSPSDAVGGQQISLRSPSDAVGGQQISLRSPSDAVGGQQISLGSPSDAVGGQQISLRSPSDAVGERPEPPQKPVHPVETRPQRRFFGSLRYPLPIESSLFIVSGPSTLSLIPSRIAFELRRPCGLRAQLRTRLGLYAHHKILFCNSLNRIEILRAQTRSLRARSTRPTLSSRKRRF